MEHRLYPQIIPLSDRLCYGASMSWSHLYCMTIEELLDIEIPVSLLLIQGDRHLEIARLEAGQSVHHKLVLHARAAGTCPLQIQGLSFRGPDGKIYNQNPERLPLDVARADPGEAGATAQLQVNLEACTLRVEEWSDLKGRITNLGGQSIPDLRMFLEGPLSCEPLPLAPLLPRSSIAFSLPILPVQAGERVPTILRVLSPSGASIFTARVFLKVTGKQVGEAKLPGTVVIQGSQVDITYGDRSSVQVGGDAVMINTKEGRARAPEDISRCSYCGRTLSQGAKFCENCGRKVS